MKVKDAMTKGCECVSPADSIQQAARKMRDLDVGSLPVCEKDRLVGMITDRDISIRAVSDGRDPKKSKIKDVMTPKIVYCFEDQGVEEAADLMRDKRIRRLAVLNHEKRLVGMLSLGDLAIETRDEHLAAETLERVSQAV